MGLLEFTAAACGVLGTLLLALRGPRAGWGFVAFLASNAGWIMFAIGQHHLGLLAQHLVFTGTSVLGIYTWLIKPHTADSNAETLFPPGETHTELLAAQARVRELERHLELVLQHARTSGAT